MSQKTGLQFATLAACLSLSLCHPLSLLLPLSSSLPTHTGNETKAQTNTFAPRTHIDDDEENDTEQETKDLKIEIRWLCKGVGTLLNGNRRSGMRQN